jgi:hypothetical protein
MTLRRRYLTVPLALCAVIFPATAYALAPSHAHIRFRAPSTVIQPLTPGGSDGSAQTILYWTPGTSTTPGVSCCTNTITRVAGYANEAPGGNTTRNWFPLTERDGVPLRYMITSRDARGNLVGSTISDPSIYSENVYIVDDLYGTYAGSWSVTNNSQDYGGTAESSTTAGDSVTGYSEFQAAWVTG